MLKYAGFLFTVLAKKASLYIVFTVFCIVFSGIFIASVKAPGVKFQVLFPISTFTKWFPFVFATLFILIVIIRIFKTGETDGTELLISSKPVSRMKIIFTRFFVLMVLTIIFQFLSFGFYLTITQIDSYATGSERLKFATSMTIGGLVLGVIISAIIIIMSAFLGRTGTLVCGIVFAAVVPILSFTIVPLSGALNPLRRQKQHELVYSSLLGTRRTNGVRQVYLPGAQEVNLTNISFLPGKSADYEKNKTTWYKDAKYVDTWYQFGRFYSLLEPEQNLGNKVSYDIKHLSYDVVSKAEFKHFYEQARQSAIHFYPDAYTLANENKLLPTEESVGLTGLFTSDEIMFEKNNLGLVFNKARYYELTKRDGSLSNEFAKLQQEVVQKVLSMNTGEQLSFRLLATNKALQTTIFNFIKQSMQALFQLKGQLPGLKQYRILVWRAIMDFQRNNEKRNFANATEVNELNLWRSWIFKFFFTEGILGPNAINFNDFALKKNQEETTIEAIYNNFSNAYYIVKNLEVKKFFNTTPVASFWTTTGLLLLAASILIYSRRDFR